MRMTRRMTTTMKVEKRYGNQPIWPLSKAICRQVHRIANHTQTHTHTHTTISITSALILRSQFIRAIHSLKCLEVLIFNKKKKNTKCPKSANSLENSSTSVGLHCLVSLVSGRMASAQYLSSTSSSFTFSERSTMSVRARKDEHTSPRSLNKPIIRNEKESKLAFTPGPVQRLGQLNGAEVPVFSRCTITFGFGFARNRKEHIDRYESDASCVPS